MSSALEASASNSASMYPALAEWTFLITFPIKSLTTQINSSKVIPVEAVVKPPDWRVRPISLC